MRLHSPPFERKLRRGVRGAVKASPALKRERKVAKRTVRHNRLLTVLRPLLSLGLGVLVWRVLEATHQSGAALAVISLWAFAFVFMQVQRLFTCLYGSTDLAALMNLPVSESVIFRWEMGKFVRGSLWLLGDLLVGFTAYAMAAGPAPGTIALVAVVSFMTWVQTVAVAVFCGAFFPRFPYMPVCTAVTVFPVVLIFAREFVGDAVMAFLQTQGPHLNLLLPTGWPVSLMQVMVPGGDKWLVLLILPVGMTWISFKTSLSRLRKGYVFAESVMPEAPDQLPDEYEATGETATPPRREERRVGVTEIEEIIRARRFLGSPSWDKQGWMESVFVRGLTRRERAMADFVFPHGLNLAASWKRIFRNLAVTVVLMLVVGLVSPAGRLWVLAGGLFVTACQMLAQAYACGAAFQKVPSGGVLIALHAVNAIGYRELGRLLFKHTLVQLPLVVVFTAIAGTLVCHAVGWRIAVGLLFGIKLGGLVIAGRFLQLTFAFSSGTNDTTRLRIRSVLLIGIVVFLCLIFLALSAASLFVPVPAVAWALWAAAGLVSWGLFRVYGWFYHTSSFDLMTVPQT